MKCKHCFEEKENSIGEKVVFCLFTGRWMNVTLGECFGNCEVQEPIKTHCIYCDAEAEVPFNEATDYVCEKCKDTYCGALSRIVEGIKEVYQSIKDGEHDAGNA